MTTKYVWVEGQPTENIMTKVLEPFDIPYDKPVFIKPNLCDPCSPRSGIVVDIDVARCLVTYLRDRGVRDIIIGEGVGQLLDIQEVFEVTRFNELRREGVKVVDLENCERVSIPWFYGSIKIPKVVIESYYINMAKIKTHTQTTISASMKNQKGLLLAETKKKFHRLGLHEPIAHLANIVKPDLVIVDGIYGIEGDGPSTMGKTKRIGILIASDNMVETDSLCSQIIGVNPRKVKHIASAEKMGLGTIKTFAVESMKFKLPNENVFKYGRINFWRTPYACSQCNYSMKKALQEIRSNPHKYPKQFLKLCYYMITGLEVYVGKDHEYNKDEKCICLGICTKNISQHNQNSIYIDGCPPDPHSIIQQIGR